MNRVNGVASVVVAHQVVNLKARVRSSASSQGD